MMKFCLLGSMPKSSAIRGPERNSCASVGYVGKDGRPEGGIPVFCEKEGDGRHDGRFCTFIGMLSLGCFVFETCRQIDVIESRARTWW